MLTLLKCRKGSVASVTAVILPVILLLVGFTVDLGRNLLVKNEFETALDAAAIGAVASSQSLNVQQEFSNLFNANTSTVSTFTHNTTIALTESPGNNKYVATATTEVPTMFLKGIGYEYLPVSASTTVKKGLGGGNPPGGGNPGGGPPSGPPPTTGSAPAAIEVAIALPDSIPDVLGQTLVKSFTDPIFATSNNSNTYVSVVPYGIGVTIENGINLNMFSKWNHADRQGKLHLWDSKTDPMWTTFSHRITAPAEKCLLGQGTLVSGGDLANYYACIKNFTKNGKAVSDDAPTDETSQFSRVLLPHTRPNLTILDPTLVQITQLKLEIPKFTKLVFAKNSNFTLPLSPIYWEEIERRPNVGLLWAWQTLSPKWKGWWDKSRATLPLAAAPDQKKIAVFIAYGDGLKATNGASRIINNPQLSESDIENAGNLCEAMKDQGIIIYTIYLTNNGSWGKSPAMKNMMKNCASDGMRDFSPKDTGELEEVVPLIIDDIFRSSTQGSANR